jgi:hypothetical protein
MLNSIRPLDLRESAVMLLGIAAAASIGGYKYWQSQTEKWAEDQRRDDPEEVKKLKA